ncbi:MAG: NADP-dependent oxidoreductase [Gammaproteobacteria bacterium]
MSRKTNRRITLAARPEGAPKDSDFEMVEDAIPTPVAGELLLKTHYLSLDPYMRGRMNEGKSYAANVALGDTMVGGAVSEVLASGHEKFAAGDFVFGYTGWQEYCVSDGAGLRRVDPDDGPLSYALGVLGMPGHTAYVGMLDIGQPQEGNTVVVSAATGAVGSVAGQLARIKGCRVVGVAGGKSKCDYAVSELRFDACIDHKSEDFAEQLEAACPHGVDVYYENVGGKVLHATVALMNVGARMPVCGLVSYYNLASAPAGPDLTPRLMRYVLTQRIKMQGFIIFDHAHREAVFRNDVSAWLKSGELRYREDVVEGLDNAVGAFQGLLEGRNFGKLVVKLV